MSLLVGELVVKITGENKEAKATLSDTEKSLGKLEKSSAKAKINVDRLGNSMALAAAGIAGFLGASLKQFSDFEAKMREANSIAKLSEEQFDKTSKAVIEMSKTLPQSAGVLASGLYDLYSAGIQGAKSLEVLKIAATAATAGVTDTATAVQGIASVMNAYGMETDKAQEVADVFFKTVERGIVRFPELVASMGQVTAVSAAAGIDFQTVSAALATMTKGGLNAAESSTALRAIIMSLIKPSAELENVYKKLGWESGAAAIKAEGLPAVLEKIGNEANNDIDILSKLIIEKRGLVGMLKLTGASAKSFAEDLKAMGGAAGSAQTAFEEQSKAFAVQFKIFTNELNAMMITIGEKVLPMVNAGMKIIKGFVGEISKMTDAQLKAKVETLIFQTAVLGLTGALIKLAPALKTIFLILKANPIIASLTGLSIAVNFVLDSMIKLNESENEHAKVALRNSTQIKKLTEDLTIFKHIQDKNSEALVQYHGEWISVSEAIKKTQTRIDGYIKQTAELNRETQQEIVNQEGLVDAYGNVTAARDADLEKMREVIAEMKKQVEETEEHKALVESMAASSSAFFFVLGENLVTSMGNFSEAIKEAFKGMLSIMLDYYLKRLAAQMALYIAMLFDPITSAAAASGIVSTGAQMTALGAMKGGIATLGKGGIVTNPQLALLGELDKPEAVIPIEKLKPLIRESVSNTNNAMTVIIQAEKIDNNTDYDRMVREKIKPAFDRLLKRQGKEAI